MDKIDTLHPLADDELKRVKERLAWCHRTYPKLPNQRAWVRQMRAEHLAFLNSLLTTKS